MDVAGSKVRHAIQVVNVLRIIILEPCSSKSTKYKDS